MGDEEWTSYLIKRPGHRDSLGTVEARPDVPAPPPRAARGSTPGIGPDDTPSFDDGVTWSEARLAIYGDFGGVPVVVEHYRDHVALVFSGVRRLVASHDDAAVLAAALLGDSFSK